MQKPTFDNFVTYEKETAPDEDGCCTCYIWYGIRNNENPNSIYLWRNYNIFDNEPTLIPEGFVLRHNGYEDCDDCNALQKCCPLDVRSRSEFIGF